MSALEIKAGDAKQPSEAKKNKRGHAAQEAAVACKNMQEALDRADYESFVQSADCLIKLAKERISNPGPLRIANPMAVAHDLLQLLANPKLQQVDSSTKYALARALHLYSDLMIIDNYERPDARKLLILEATKMDYLGKVGNFNALCCSPDELPTKYELDCCYANIHSMEDGHNAWSDIKAALVLAVDQNVMGLLSLAAGLQGRLNKHWQVDVLLIRRLTPLAQQSLKVLKMLQQIIAESRKTKHYQTIYAAQEALHEIVINCEDKLREEIIPQVFGLNWPKEQTKKEITLQYFVGQNAGPRSAVFKLKDLSRFRFIQALRELSRGWGETVLDKEYQEHAYIMLCYLAHTEPASHTHSRQWISNSLKSLFGSFADTKRRDSLTLKAEQQAKAQLESEQKRLMDIERKLEDEQKHRETLTKSKLELEAALAQLAADKNRLEEEKSKLGDTLAESKSKLETTLQQLTADKTHLEEERSRLVSEKQALEQKMQEKTHAMKQKSKEEETEQAKLNQRQMELVKTEQSIQQRAEELEKVTEDLRLLDLEQDKKAAQLEGDKKELEQKQKEDARHRKEFQEQMRISQKELDNMKFVIKQQIEAIEDGLSKPDKKLEPTPVLSTKHSPVKPWPEPGLNAAFCEAAKDIVLKRSYMCPLLARPAYDMVILKVKNTYSGHYEEYSMSDQAARNWLIIEQQTTCPFSRFPVKEVIIPRHIRDDIEEEIKKILAKRRVDAELVAKLKAEQEAEAARHAAFEIERQRKITEQKAQEAKESQVLNEFLSCVVANKLAEAEKIVQMMPSIVSKKGVIKNLAGDEFPEMSAFQFTVLGKNWHMWKMLLKYMSKQEAAIQFAEIEQIKMADSPHFSLLPLIKEIRAYVRNHDAWSKEGTIAAREAREEQLYRKIGGLQRLLFAHKVHQYCYPGRSFDPCPTFKEGVLPISTKCDEGEWDSCVYNGGKLGEKFFICRSGHGEARAFTVESRSLCLMLNTDALALESLERMGLEQLQILRAELQGQAHTVQLGLKG